MDGTLIATAVVVVWVVGLAVVGIFIHIGAMHAVKLCCGCIDLSGVVEKKDGVYDYGWRDVERVRLCLYRAWFAFA